MARRLAAICALIILLLTPVGALLAQTCTATKQNAFYGNDNAATNTATVTANISAIGDLVAFTGWCFRGCAPISVTMGGQTAIQTTVSGVVDNSNPGSGQGFIFYILSAAAAGSQTVTWTVSGSHSGIQVSYIDFKPSAGCKFTHNVDSPLGSCLSGPCLGNTGAPAIVNAPSITPTAGDLLFNFTWSSEHVNDILSPWSCPIYAGGTGDCQFAGTRNVAAYILSAASGATANNTTTTHDSDTWQALLTSFTITPNAQAPKAPTNLQATVQ
jgi:hypothetical protein